MAAVIDRDIIEAYLACKLKAHLRCTGESGLETEYTQLLLERQTLFRHRATESALHGVDGKAIRNVAATASTLAEAHPLILDASIQSVDFDVRCDALRKIEGSSQLGSFLYAPVIFSQTKSPAPELLVAICGSLLAAVQGVCPSTGFVIYGENCSVSKITIDGLLRSKAQQLLDEIRQIGGAQSSPPLILNKHCHRCVFQNRCQAEAEAKDDLSLLRGMSPKEIARCHRKGILTLTQLSHTFRPRRNRNRRQRKGHVFPLEALAIREKKILVFGTPTLPQTPVHIFFDIEGDPFSGCHFLLGLLVCDQQGEREYSFWADDAAQEDKAFEQLLGVLEQFDDYRLFFYGSYEAKYLRSRQRRAGGDARIQRAIACSVNVLAVIYSHVYFPVYHNGLKDIARYLGFC